jgi:putative phosphoribosyl transferase
MSNARERAIEIPLGDVTLHGDLAVPAEPRGLVLFAHGSGSSRRSPRNRYVAGVLQQAQIATLLFDLLTSAEEQVDAHTAELRFDIEMLASRLEHATDWVLGFPDFNPDGRVTPDDIRIGYFGASTGAAAALIAAASHPDIAAVVSRGGRPDLAGEALPRVTAPTLLIVGGDDDVVIGMNKTARAKMTAETRLEIVPGASHLFEEPGTLEEVARLARMWFEEHLGRKVASDYAA